MAIPGESNDTPAIEAPPDAGARLRWRTATVATIIEETPRVRSLVLDVADWPGHRPGQHVDVRLTGEDGYRAQRSYSIASAPEAARITLTIERIDNGEVSPYLSDDVRAGDRFELRGPIGGYFVWTVAQGGPLFLIAGGSGVVPLMAMLRHRTAHASRIPAVLLYSSRSDDEIVYREELDRLAEGGDGLRVVHTLTRRQPEGWRGGTRRIDGAMLSEVGPPPEARPLVFICGPTTLVESVSGLLARAGYDPGRLKTERFGPTGS